LALSAFDTLVSVLDLLLAGTNDKRKFDSVVTNRHNKLRKKRIKDLAHNIQINGQIVGYPSLTAE
jgi:hypothetical protein